MKLLTKEEILAKIGDEVFAKITETADEKGCECYLVGGYVRDLFLQRPTNDIDVVVVGSGIAMAKAFAARLKGKAAVSVFANFGTAQVKWHNH